MILRPVSRKTRAFSLVELLVVIAIIAVLLAILLPVLLMVRKSSRATACLANLSQWGQSYQMYLNGNKGKSFLNRKDLIDLAWYEQLKPFNGDIHRTLLCPEATDPGNAIGASDKAWGPNRSFISTAPNWQIRDTFVGSYGFNGWLWRIPSEEAAVARAAYMKYVLELPTTHADNVPVFADCIEEWGTPKDTDTPPYDLKNPLPRSDVVKDPTAPPGPVGMMALFCIDRHRSAVNVVFLDGHAARVPLPELWRLKWNGSFVPNDVVVGR
jgi:prepilin-type N-terminal cleavage/methylation domain-containing protein/prepilin-type processing-associated H-X9-DG protein